MKLPRREVLEEQAKAMREAEAELREDELEEVSGGIILPVLVLMYGIGIIHQLIK